MYIIGICCYSHESSCALLKDGELRVLIEEERLNREKHTWKFPINAIRQCLDFEGIGIDDVDHFTFFIKPWLEVSGNLAHVLRHFPESLHLFRAPMGGGANLGALARMRACLSVGKEIQREFGLRRPPQVHFIEHHLAHAASAFFVSEFNEAAILSVDGRGESATTLLARGQGATIEKLREIRVPHSLGHLYAAVTRHLGFKPFVDEWKVMGMAAYGSDARVKDFQDVLILEEDGGFRLNLGYFKFHTHGPARWMSPRFESVFGNARSGPEQKLEQSHFDLARALQLRVEEAGVHLANTLYRLTGSENLCMAGGVALNVLMNERTLRETPFKRVFIQPIANDAGTSMGSALYFHHQIMKYPRQWVFESPYLGPSFAPARVEELLRARGLAYSRPDDIARTAAQVVADGRILGWFQGRMEAGPRALGNRSIIADPRRHDMKDRLNRRVKRREFFRPFAPSVLEERAAEYFDLPKGQSSPYMILSARVLQEKREILPAVTHVDGSARVHTVSRNANPRYWNLISRFAEITGVPVVLNTSFNENEPIVCTPEEALDCFLRTDFDALAIGDFLLEKKERTS